MDCEFDLYEMFPDHSIQWRSCVRGTQRALEAAARNGSANGERVLRN